MTLRKKISELTETTSPTLSGITTLVQNGTTYKSQIGTILNSPYLITTNRTICVETTGNDVTGDGISGSTPYATIERALYDLKGYMISGCTINIQLGEGTWDWNGDINVNASYITLGPLGNLRLIGKSEYVGDYTFTQTGDTAVTYAISEGIPSDNYFLDCYIDYNTNIKPIFGRHDTSYVTVARRDITGTHSVYRKLSQINVNAIGASTTGNLFQLELPVRNLASGKNLSTNGVVAAHFLIFNVAGSVQTIRDRRLDYFQGCTFRAVEGLSTYMFDGDNREGKPLYLRHCHLDLFSGTTTLDAAYSGDIIAARVLCEGNPDNKQRSAWSSFEKDSCIRDYQSENVIKNLQYGFYNVWYPDYFNFGRAEFYFINLSAIGHFAECTIEKSDNYGSINLSNVDYYVKLFRSTQYKINLTTLMTGTPNLGLISGTPDGYWNPSAGNDIRLPGLYREVDTIDDTTITDNNVTNIVIGDTGQTRSVHLMYTLIRDTSYEEGIIKVLYDGTTTYTTTDSQDNTVSSGVTFASDINGAEIRLTATATSTGSNGTFKADVKRVMI